MFPLLSFSCVCNYMMCVCLTNVERWSNKILFWYLIKKTNLVSIISHTLSPEWRLGCALGSNSIWRNVLHFKVKGTPSRRVLGAIFHYCLLLETRLQMAQSRKRRLTPSDESDDSIATPQTTEDLVREGNQRSSRMRLMIVDISWQNVKFARKKVRRLEESNEASADEQSEYEDLEIDNEPASRRASASASGSANTHKQMVRKKTSCTFHYLLNECIIRISLSMALYRAWKSWISCATST